MIEIVIVLVIVFLLFGIFKRSRREPRGLGVQPCPYCRTFMHARATVCQACGKESRRLSLRDRLWQKPPEKV